MCLYCIYVPKLKDKFPEIFDRDDSKRRLYFAMRAVVQIHATSRQQKGTAIKRKRNGRKIVAVSNAVNGDVVDLVSDH